MRLWPAVSWHWLPTVPRERGLGRPAVGPGIAGPGQETFTQPQSLFRREAARARQEGGQFQQPASISNCFSELLPTALGACGKKEIHFIYLI